VVSPSKGGGMISPRGLISKMLSQCS
jgi:hypothetical protein